jgi:hypothetical protein
MGAASWAGIAVLHQSSNLNLVPSIRVLLVVVLIAYGMLYSVEKYVIRDGALKITSKSSSKLKTGPLFKLRAGKT